jgi:hypothetical protein
MATSTFDTLNATTAITVNSVAVPTISSTSTLTNKTISGASNTITNVSLTTGVTGTLPIANGGTGVTEFPKVRAQQTGSAQSVSNNTFTKVNFGTENEDTGADFATGTFTAPRTGHILVTGAIAWQALPGAATQMIVEIYKNGATHLRCSNHPGASGGQPAFQYAAIVNVSASDTIEIYCYQNTGSSVNLEVNSNTHLEIAYMP